MRVLGIDLGSREVKIMVSDNGTFIHKSKISTMHFYRDFCTHGKNILFDYKALGLNNIDVFVSTGYGKNNLSLTGFTAINEIKAHVYGTFKKSTYRDFIMLDIGGQDVKIVKVEKGIITDLNLNDKCAASCGRYIENMASVLETDYNTLSSFYNNPVILNSTCSVFSESELIGKIAEGADFQSLCAGVNYSLYMRIKPLLSGFPGERIILSGGVADNSAIHHYISNDYKEVIKINEPQFNGAAGCCYFGERMGK